MSSFPPPALSAAVALALPLVIGLAPASPAAGDAHAALDPVTLDRLRVHGRRTGLDVPATGGTRLDLSLRQTPASVFVIDRQALEARGVRSTQEALFGVPGLDVASPPGNGNAVNWRGFSGGQVTQLFNGIDVKYASIAARPVDAWIYERVEAIGGPSSFLYGAGAVGGSINYVTRQADFERDGIGGMVRIGAFGTGVIAAGLNHRFGGGAEAGQALRVDAGHSRRSGWVDAERREAWTVAASLASRPSRAFTHTLALEVQDEDNDRIYWGSPALADANGRLAIVPGTAGRNYNAGDGFYGQQVLWARSISEWEIGAGTSIANTLYHYDALRDYRNIESYRYNDARDGVIRSGALLQRHDQQVYGNRVDWHWTGTLAGRSSQWVAALDVSYNRQTRFPQSIGGDVDTVPVGARTPGRFFDVPGTSPGFVPGATNRLRTQALSVENMTRLTPRVGLMTGLRHERLGLAVQNHRTPTPTSPARWERDYAPTTGRAGLSLDATDASNLYVQFSTAADPPAGILSTAGFSVLRDFDLSRGRQVEAGAKTEFADGRGMATVAAYRIVRENLAISDPDAPGQTLPVGRQSARGLELSVDLRPADVLRVQANLGLVDARLDDFYENVGGIPVSRAGNRPANAPSRVANLWLDYALSERWSAGADARAVAARYGNNANTLHTAGYGLWGAYLRWRPTAHLAVTLRGRNLGDREYALRAAGANMVYLGEPRSVELELRSMF